MKIVLLLKDKSIELFSSTKGVVGYANVLTDEGNAVVKPDYEEIKEWINEAFDMYIKFDDVQEKKSFLENFLLKR